MKKFLTAFLLVCLIATAAAAAENKVGVLAKLNMTPEEYLRFASARRNAGQSQFFTAKSKEAETVYVYYDSLSALQLALEAGDVDEIELPESVAEYVMNMSGKFHVSSVLRTTPLNLAFGFRASDDPVIRNKFNEALLSMKADGTLAILEAKYIADPGLDEPEPVKFEKFDNVDVKVKVAVTGDLPPIDFVAADGTPAGFNTAVLAEIGKRLKINIELVNIEAGARVVSLTSGRVDSVFWFQSYKKLDGTQPDIPQGVALSEPYYQWNEYLYLTK
ncbi:MAG: transporter substrate-binding domain-containing protein [Synergistaceae bacterium]|nr:transporter substrate-binding domain-containing protein [Synergistaceae bacterium]